MALYFRKSDILKSKDDAIVITNNKILKLGGMMGNALLKACGPQIQDELNSIGSCKETECVVTKAYGLNFKYIIHAVGPIFESGSQAEYDKLSKTFDNVFAKAKELGINSVSVPLISSGAFCFPNREVTEIAVKRAKNFLKKNKLDISITIYSKKTFDEVKDLLKGIPEKNGNGFVYQVEYKALIERLRNSRASSLEGITYSSLLPYKDKYKNDKKPLNEVIDELIKKSKLSTSDFCEASNLSGQTLSKIRNGLTKPKLSTLVAISIGLKLSYPELKQLLCSAGISFDESYVFGQITKDFFENHIYDINKFNSVLVMSGLDPVGTKSKS